MFPLIFSRIATLRSQVSGFVRHLFCSPRLPSEEPHPPHSVLEYDNILESIFDDSELISALSKMAASKGPSPWANLAIPVDYTILDKLYGVCVPTRPIIQALGKRITYPTRNMTKGLILRLIHGGRGDRLPSSLYLNDVTFHSANDKILSGSADIYKGSNASGLLALKYLRSNTSARRTRDSIMDEFAHEVLVWADLEHPHIVRLLGIAPTGLEDLPGHFMVSPWMEKGNLLSYMEELHEHQYPEFLKRATRLLYQVAQAIEYCHEHGIVHGDVRGANILIDANEKAYLSDFGSATLVGVYNFREIKFRKGNAKICAPELHLSAEEPSFPCDVYSFAMLCIEVFLGRPLFHGWKDPTIIMEIANRNSMPPIPKDEGHPMPKELEALVKSCRQNCPSKRPTISQVVARMRVIYEVINLDD